MADEQKQNAQQAAGTQGQAGSGNQPLSEEELKKQKEQEAKVRAEMGFTDDFLSDDYTPSAGDLGDDKKQQIKTFKLDPHPNTTFDEQQFKDLLADSISLSFNEKMQILKAIPKLNQFQIDELSKILAEEKVKLEELNRKHAEQLKAFEEKKKGNNWDVLANKANEEAKKEQDQSQIDKLKGDLDKV